MWNFVNILTPSVANDRYRPPTDVHVTVIGLQAFSEGSTHRTVTIFESLAGMPAGAAPHLPLFLKNITAMVRKEFRLRWFKFPDIFLCGDAPCIHDIRLKSRRN
jgi:hypothetical protein